VLSENLLMGSPKTQQMLPSAVYYILMKVRISKKNH